MGENQDNELAAQKPDKWHKLWNQLLACLSESQIPAIITAGSSVVIAIFLAIIAFKSFSIDSKLDYLVRCSNNTMRLFY